MVVGFDIDGTITKHLEFFSFLTRALIKEGHKVMIITSRDDKTLTDKDLKEWEIVYSELVVADYIANDDLDRWKAQVCLEKGVEIYFEDDPDVLKLIEKEIASFLPFNQSKREQ